MFKLIVKRLMNLDISFMLQNESVRVISPDNTANG
jgi:hypothetical protein